MCRNGCLGTLRFSEILDLQIVQLKGTRETCHRETGGLSDDHEIIISVNGPSPESLPIERGGVGKGSGDVKTCGGPAWHGRDAFALGID